MKWLLNILIFFYHIIQDRINISIKKCPHLRCIETFILQSQGKQGFLSLQIALAMCTLQASLLSKITPKTFIDFFERTSVYCCVCGEKVGHDEKCCWALTEKSAAVNVDGIFLYWHWQMHVDVDFLK